MLAGQVAYIVALDYIRVFSRFGVFAEILTAYLALKTRNDY